MTTGPKLKILHVLPGTALQAVPWAYDVITGLCQEQVATGHQVRVLATNRGLSAADSENLRATRVGGVEVFHFPVDQWVEMQPIRILRRFYVSSALVQEIKRTIPLFDIVHIHFVFPFPSIMAARWCRRLAVPYVISPLGNLDPVLHRKSRRSKSIYLRLFGRRALNRASAVHFLSTGEQRMASSFGVSSPQVVIGLGVDSERYRPGPRSGRFRAQFCPHAERLIFFLGRIAPSKGLDLLVNAFAALAERDPGLHLALAGPDDGGYTQTIAELIRKKDLQNRVTLTGPLSEEEKIWAFRDADVFASLAYTEALGLAMLEAMATGLPVLLTNRAALAPRLASAGAALVVAPEVTAVAAGLAELLQNRLLWSALSTAGRAFVVGEFAWPAIAASFLNLYQAILMKPASLALPHDRPLPLVAPEPDPPSPMVSTQP